MKTVLPVFLLFFSTQVCRAQQLTVRDQDTGSPLELVTVFSPDLDLYTSTNTDGQVAMDRFRGAEQLIFSLLGYKSVEISYATLRQQGFSLELQPAQLELDQIVVSATRWAQPRRKSPNKVSVVRASEVALNNPQTAADLLGSSGEVFIQKSQQGGGSPMIRGFSTNRLLYAVDGVRMNTAIFRSGNLQNVLSLDPFAIERTEILFGPGSVLYGSDAIGGVMRFETLQSRLSSSGDTEISGSATARYATANQEQTAHLDLNIGGEKWAWRGSISSNQFGDLRMGRFGADDYLRPFYTQRIDSQDVVVQNLDPLVQRPTGYDQISTLQKIRYAPNARWDFNYALHHSATSNYPRYDRLIRTRGNRPIAARWDYGPQVWTRHQFTASHRGDQALYNRATLHLAWQRFEESRIDRDFGSPLRTERREEVLAYSVNLDLLKQLSERHTLLYGLEVVLNTVNSDGTQTNIDRNTTRAFSDRYPQADWQSYAAYLTHQWNLDARWDLQVGLRYNQFALQADFRQNQDFFPLPFSTATLHNDALTGSVGAVFQPDPSWNLSLLASTAFRAPNVDDAGKVFDSEPGSVVVPNPALQAEYAYNAELSVGKRLGDRARAQVSVYYTYLNNALVRRNGQLAGRDSVFYDGGLSQVQTIQNAARSYVYGLEAYLELQLHRSFTFSTRYSLQQGEEELQNGSLSPSRHVAPAFGRSALRFRQNGLDLELYAVYHAGIPFEELNVGERGKPYLYAQDAQGRPHSPAWYTINAKARCQLDERFTVAGGLENITDQRYRPYSSGLAGPGRNLILSVQADF